MSFFVDHSKEETRTCSMCRCTSTFVGCENVPPQFGFLCDRCKSERKRILEDACKSSNKSVGENEMSMSDLMIAAKEKYDNVNHPTHYTKHPSGIECIQITEHMNFNLGNAVKYIWRTYEKGDPNENLNKAIWYIKREIERIRNKGNE